MRTSPPGKEPLGSGCITIDPLFDPPSYIVIFPVPVFGFSLKCPSGALEINSPLFEAKDCAVQLASTIKFVPEI